MAHTFWLFVIVDTAAEVIFVTPSTLTHPVFTRLLNMN
jgi:hypothetical protein